MILSNKKNICVITGSRAEYGLLYPLLVLLKKSNQINLQIVATGSHLSSSFGATYKEIESDGFQIDKKVEMTLASDTPSSISKSTGLGIIGFSDVFTDLNPSVVVVLGDRYEVLAAAIAAYFSNILIAHLHGGETTLGAYDEGIRHSVTKMSWLHFVAAESYKKRVIQLGEEEDRVFNVGGLGVDNIKKTKLLTKRELIKKTGIQFGKKNILVTFHSVTLEGASSIKQLKVILDVLSDFTDLYIIFTLPNSDKNSVALKELIEGFVLSNKNTISFKSLGRLKYLSTLRYIDGVLGNSSSGLLEVPSFNIGTVNIGDRQEGRLKASSVIDCKPDKKSIQKAIRKLFSVKFRESIRSVVNPYGKGDASKKILEILQNISKPKNLKKPFHDLP